jgi:hypothetical protein
MNRFQEITDSGRSTAAIAVVLRPPRQINTDADWRPRSSGTLSKLLVVDEADRLKSTGLEQLRDNLRPPQDRARPTGMPGLGAARPATRSCTPGSSSPTNTGR